MVGKCYFRLSFLVGFLLISILFPACRRSSSRANSDISKKIEYKIAVQKEDLEAMGQLRLSDRVEAYTLVFLETKPTCLIGSIDKIYVTDSLIYVMDNEFMHSIFVFDLSGKFRFKVSARGKGNFEYSFMDDFVLDDERKEILILDGQLKRLFVFDSENGQPVRTHPLTFFADKFERLKGDTLAFLGSAREDRLLLWDMGKNKLLNSYFAYDMKQSVGALKPFHRFDDRVFYTRNLTDTILEVTGARMTSSRVIDYGEYAVNDQVLQENQFGTLSAPGNFMANTRLYQENEDFIYFVFDYEALNQESPYYVLYSKSSGNIMYYTNQTMVDDITFYPYAPQLLTTSTDGRFVFPLEAIYVKEATDILLAAKEGDRYGIERKERFLNTVDGIKESDNPIIVLYSFKTF
ncbi:6-bladed beta-propeller [Parapedobacter sp. 10938]|uniref:6-bladed beta-propeller n=1 Tax=Parapedobacter flavus TaxID=3110225 RepID=UPI002DBE5947|nr:6-bladed beta-propeller [Parapedobacter sp. 10938]MEC3882094.1 6-bladed beta-propeller [Parapedobacter sp. 10938]